MNIKFITTTDSTHIKLYQQGASLYAGPIEADIEDLEATAIEEVTSQEVVLITSRSKTLYHITSAAYWRAWHGSEEPDVIWAGMMEAQAALARQEANIEEILLINSTPLELRQPEPICAFGPFNENGERQPCSNRATLAHITEDIGRPGGYVILPICETCNKERLRAKYVEPPDVELDSNVAYAVGQEG